MRTYLDCYPCFLRQALDAARWAGATESQQRAVVEEALCALRDASPEATPPEIGAVVHSLVRRVCGHGDPYQAAKEASTRQALALYPRLRERVARAADPFDVALRLSIAGNILDLAPGHQYDLWSVIERVLAQSFAIDHSGRLRTALRGASHVLYLADNAGEAVFDRLLIEVLDRPVVYAVKGGAVLNDATREDAYAAGVQHVAEIIDTGSDTPGTILSRCSRAFREMYAAADLIIAKGQANYETLSDAGPRVYLLLQTKCAVIARDVGVPLGSIVVVQGTG
ncbi:MAG: DUF89 family protein [Anaerolineae bacterium]|nr:DUF89 family protein [Anaerolineae bacterium]